MTLLQTPSLPHVTFGGTFPYRDSEATFLTHMPFCYENREGLKDWIFATNAEKAQPWFWRPKRCSLDFDLVKVLSFNFSKFRKFVFLKHKISELYYRVIVTYVKVSINIDFWMKNKSPFHLRNNKLLILSEYHIIYSLISESE